MNAGMGPVMGTREELDPQQLADCLSLMQEVDRQVTPGHVAARFQELKADVRHARLRRLCGSVLHHKRTIAAMAAAVGIVVCTPVAVGARSVPANLRRVTIPAIYSVQFRPGQFTLSDADRNTLDGLVDVIEQSSGSVTITGYADGLATAVADRSLALKRAQAVAAFLRTRGISTPGLVIHGVHLHVPGPASRSVTIFVWEHSGNG